MKGLKVPPGRRRIALLGVAILLLAAAVPVALSVIPSRADAAASANGQPNPLGNLAGRSPGERLVGVAMKAAKVVRETLGVGPSEPEKRAERALARPPAQAVPPAGEEVALVPDQPIGPFAAESIPELDGLPGDTPPGPGLSVGGPGFGLIPVNAGGGGGGGGDTPGGGNETTPVPPPPPTSAVPEPATWAMMILGFGLLGASMRRQSRKDRLARAL